MSGKRSTDDFGVNCLAAVIFGSILMPFVGLYMIAKSDTNGGKIAGVVLTIVGFILWIYFLN